MTFYRARAGTVGLNRAQSPGYRTAAVAAGSAPGTAGNRSAQYIPRQLTVGVDGISSDTPGASVLVEQTGPDSVTISEIVDGQTVDQVVLPVITIPAPAADGGVAGEASRRSLVSRIASAVVTRMSWEADGNGGYLISPGENEVITISGDANVAIVTAAPIPPG